MIPVLKTIQLYWQKWKRGNISNAHELVRDWVCIYSSHGLSEPHILQAVLEYVREMKMKKALECETVAFQKGEADNNHKK